MSGIGHIKLRLVHAYQTDYVELGDQFVHLWRFADMADGHMEEIHELRDAGPMSPFSLSMMPTVAGWPPGLKAMRMKPLRSCTMPAQEPTFRWCTRSGISSVSARAWLCPRQRATGHHELQVKLRRLPPLAGVVHPKRLGRWRSCRFCRP
jgi:hypothetical protein